MGLFTRLPERWSNAPFAVVAIVALLLLAGIGAILQNEAAYRDRQVEETRIEADVLAAGVGTALDAGDAATARRAVEAFRVNRRVRSVGVYARGGDLVAGYGRDGTGPPRRLAGIAPAGDNAVISSVPVVHRGARIGTVVLASDPDPLSQRLNRYFVIALLILMAVLVVAVLVLGQAALRRANRQLGERAEALARANAEWQIEMGERGKAEDQLRQAHKMQALGQLTGGIAHDFNNLLTVIQGSADMLRRPGLAEDKRMRFAEAVVQASAKAAALTGQLLAFARRQPLQPEVIEVNELIREMTDLLDRTLGERIRIITDLTDGACRVEADRAQLESALLNVAVNARDAMPNGGQLVIKTEGIDDPERGPMIAILVSDSGVGMDEDTKGRVFEPFFTTKMTGKGTGLGLSQVYGFASQSGGDVRIASVVDMGTTVSLLLPCSNAHAETRAPEDAGTPPRGRTGHILLVEDNDEVGEFAEQLLAELGHGVRRVRSGELALRLVESETFDLVFTDVVMPGMSGLELAGKIAGMKPGLPIILTTGFSDEIAQSGAGGLPVILKPYRPETLAAAIDQVLRA